MLMADTQKSYMIGDIVFNPGELKLVTKNESITLTLREKELLEFLCLHPNKVLKREDILNHVWGKNDFFLGRSMDVFIAKLRKYLNSEPRVSIETIHGLEYRFTTDY